MSEQNIEFQSVDLVIDDGTHNNNTIVSNDKSKKEKIGRASCRERV